MFVSWSRHRSPAEKEKNKLMGNTFKVLVLHRNKRWHLFWSNSFREISKCWALTLFSVTYVSSSLVQMIIIRCKLVVVVWVETVPIRITRLRFGKFSALAHLARAFGWWRASSELGHDVAGKHILGELYRHQNLIQQGCLDSDDVVFDIGLRETRRI